MSVQWISPVGGGAKRRRIGSRVTGKSLDIELGISETPWRETIRPLHVCTASF